MKASKDALKSKKQPFPDLSVQEAQTVSLSLRAFMSRRQADFPGDEEGGVQSPSFRTESDVLLWCAGLVLRSPTAGALLRSAAAGGWCIGLADLQGGGYSFDFDQRSILLDRCALSVQALGRSGYFRYSLLMAFIRALRDVDTENRFRAMETRLMPEAFMILARLRNADCDTIALLCAWELRGAGFPHVWRHMIGSPEGDMAIAFVKRLDVAPSAVPDPAALFCAFRQWFGETSRMSSSDHDALEFLDDTLESARTRNPFGQARLNAMLVESLAILPDGTAYLAGVGREILADPSYLDMDDLVNQTHLLHIMRDLETVVVSDVPFRDQALARRIFPDAPLSRIGR